MASRTRSQTNDFVPTFYEQNLLKESSKEVCLFDNADIAALRTSGLQCRFSAFISRFFELTGLSYAQTMPMVWRVLVTLDQIKARHVPDLCIEDLPISYLLRSHGSSRFLLFSTSKDPLILKATKNEDDWR
ncbi:hypothetical protein Hanom_Chr12g01147911 [Helianthus anomalus]